MANDREAAAMAFPELARVAPILNRKRGWCIPMFPVADMLGGCIYRLDEVVRSNHEVTNALRPILRYRTMLARGEPEEELRERWAAAKVLFPRWVGFRRRRLRWTRWCEIAYQQMEKDVDAFIRHADAWDRAERVAEIRKRLSMSEASSPAEQESPQTGAAEVARAVQHDDED